MAQLFISKQLFLLKTVNYISMEKGNKVEYISWTKATERN